MQATFATKRIAKTINRDWKFHYDPAETPDLFLPDPAFEDANWRAIALPHTWSTYETTGDLHPFIRDAAETDDPYWWHGWGCYRKRFGLGTMHRDRKVFLEFDGVQKHSIVYVNGRRVGEHMGGFNSFSMDITEHVRFGSGEVSVNTLAVLVSNRRDDPHCIPPMTAGNWNVYGGIYRDVRLVLTDRVFIPFQGSADHEGGTFVTTPTIDEGAATVRVRTWVRNEHPSPVECLLRTAILDPDGQFVTEMQSAHKVAPSQTFMFDQHSESIPNPQLWSPDTPNVYQVRTLLVADGQRADHWTSPLGFRWFRWDYDERRLYLNGQQVHIHGTNRHQEYPWLGDAIPKWMHLADLEDMRLNLGHNFLRTCHYIQDPVVYDLCDRLGIICCEEVPNIKNIRFNDGVQRQNVIEMVRRDRNHPSILMWSMGNETSCAADGDWARAEDATRIIHFRKVVGRGEDEPHNSDQIDMENLLRCTIRGWYNRDVMDLEPTNETYGTAKSGQVAGTEEWQHIMSRVEDGSIRGRIDGNMVVWLYNDHGADREYRHAPLKHVNPKGWVDPYRIPKYMYYLWQANYADKLMAFVQPHFWRRSYLGQLRDMVVDSNGDTVELFVNGVSLGVHALTAAEFHTTTFQGVLIQEGTITALARRGAESVECSVTMAGDPTRLSLSTDQAEIAANRSGIAIVRADVVDADGVHVYGATQPLHWAIEGPGTLVGPAQFVSDIDKHEAPEGTMYIDAPVCMPIRASNEPGTIIVTVSSPGLESATIQIRSVPPGHASVSGLWEPIAPDGDAQERHPGVRGASAADPHRGGQIPARSTDMYLGPGIAQRYREAIDQEIRRRCPDVEIQHHEYEALLDGLVVAAVREGGTLIADDYNFSVDEFNRKVAGGAPATALTPEDLTRDPDCVTRHVAWSGSPVTLRLLGRDDGDRLGAYFEELGPGTRSFYGPHPFTLREARQLCDEIDYAHTLRCVATIDQSAGEEIIAYFILVLGVQGADTSRYDKLGLPLDPGSDCTLAPSVADRFQSQGLGNLIMPWVQSIARQLGKRRMILMGGVQEANVRGRRFYTKFGFRKVGEFTNRAGTINSYDMMATLDR